MCSTRYGCMMALIVLVVSCCLVDTTQAQYSVFSKDDMLKYTSLWKGDRFPDGRPKVPDSVLEKLRGAALEDIMGPLQSLGQQTVNNSGRWKHGYTNQIETEGWLVMHPTRPMVGRAVTCSFMPARGDINDWIEKDGAAAGFSGGQNTWPIDQLVTGDVIVADMFGKIKDGTFAGDNLATTIASRVGPNGGMVVDGSVRDAGGIFEIPDFNTFVRAYHHSAIAEVMLMGINIPVRIGRSTCMPGDVVVGSIEGVAFIPAHLAEGVAEAVYTTQLRTIFGKQRIKEGTYTAGQIDRKWDPEVEADYAKWKVEYEARKK